MGYEVFPRILVLTPLRFELHTILGARQEVMKGS
jgi:hypothetical protein